MSAAAPAAAADCPACAVAQHQADTGRYRAGCIECAARLLANGQEHFYAMQAAAFTPRYRSELQQVFGADWMRGHERVRHWSRQIESQRQLRAMKGAGDAA